MRPRLDNRSYYDAMATTYERERHRGYHAFVDDEEVACAADLVQGADLLEVGCGTGLILRRLAPRTRRLVGVDLSSAMLHQARNRHPSVVQANALALPFADGSFDVVVSFKVLPHVPEIRAALAEMARVIRPGGHLVLEFYNRRSLRHVLKRFKPSSSVAVDVNDTDVYTRYDNIQEAVSYLPDNLEIVRVHGIRIALPAAFLMRLPILGPACMAIERLLSRTPLRRLGGFVILVARLRGTSQRD